MRPAVFLDRDGTIIDEVGHLGDPARVVVLPGAAAALRRLADAGYSLVVVSNQAGVARGYFSDRDVAAVRTRIAELLSADGAAIDAWYHCPHHPDLTGPCECRKPAPGMLRRAASEHHLDLARSWMVGDHLVDVRAAEAAGVRPVKVRTGHGMLHGDGDPGPHVPVVDDLPAAASLILGSGA